MDFLNNLSVGLVSAVSPENLLYCLIGCVLGTLIGVLPGIGPAATIAMLMPMTFSLDPTASLIMLAGIYYGAQYGGSTTAILVNLPGESASVVTAIDGYKMARQGRGGLALATAALCSFFAGSVATLVIAVFAPILSTVAIHFGAADYFSLMLVGLIASITLAHGSALKALGMVVLGLLVGLVGIDITSGLPRMTMGVPELSDGIEIVAVAMGLFGLGEIIHNLERGGDEPRTAVAAKVASLMPRWADLKHMFLPAVRGTALGTMLGALPGGSATLASFAAYAVEKKVSRNPSRFGNGALEGVAGPEAANNAGAQASFIPMLTLGIPSNAIMALMIGALMIQGIQPGPSMIREQPTLFWGLIVSMWIGNLMLVVLNLPLIGIWVKLLSIRYSFLFPSIMVFCAIGVFSIHNSNFDIYVMAIFGLLGYLFKKFDGEPAPFLLGLVLGPMMEESLRRAMLISRGDPMIFIERPISAGLLALAFIALLAVALPAIRRKRDIALAEES